MFAMNFETLLYEVKDNIAKITMNDPKVLNAMSPKMFNELRLAVAEVARDASVRCVVLTGAGDAFSSGANLSSSGEMSLDSPVGLKTWVRQINGLVSDIMTCEKIFIAAINGVAAGAGINTALCCDITIAKESAKLIQVFVRRGLVPDFGGMYLLPRLVGIARAKELIFTGDSILAKDAAAMGMLTRAVPDEKFDEEVSAWATRMANGPTKTLGLAKLGINLGLSQNLEEALQYEASAQAFTFTTDDMKEAIRAFFTKEPPQFKGK